MFLIIKVNVAIDLRLFQGTLKPLQACRIKNNYRGWLPAYEKCRPLWLPDEEKFSTAARNTFNIRRGR